MRLTICAVGRLKAGPERDLVARYMERANASGKPLALHPITIVEIPESRARHPGSRQDEEGHALRAAAGDGLLIALDEKAPSLSSADLARQIGAWRDHGLASLAFLIGGADGLSGALREQADLSLSFGKMTWPHQLVRILLAEQLYRVTTIMAGHPYHRA